MLHRKENPEYRCDLKQTAGPGACADALLDMMDDLLTLSLEGADGIDYPLRWYLRPVWFGSGLATTGSMLTPIPKQTCENNGKSLNLCHRILEK